MLTNILAKFPVSTALHHIKTWLTVSTRLCLCHVSFLKLIEHSASSFEDLGVRVFIVDTSVFLTLDHSPQLGNLPTSIFETFRILTYIWISLDACKYSACPSSIGRLNFFDNVCKFLQFCSSSLLFVLVFVFDFIICRAQKAILQCKKLGLFYTM